MPQSERANNIKKLLQWISESEEGRTVQACLAYVINEITELGATEPTARKYLEALGKANLITYKQPFWSITKAGRDWLERHA